MEPERLMTRAGDRPEIDYPYTTGMLAEMARTFTERYGEIRGYERKVEEIELELDGEEPSLEQAEQMHDLRLQARLAKRSLDALNDRYLTTLEELEAAQAIARADLQRRLAATA